MSPNIIDKTTRIRVGASGIWRVDRIFLREDLVTPGEWLVVLDLWGVDARKGEEFYFHELKRLLQNGSATILPKEKDEQSA